MNQTPIKRFTPGIVLEEINKFRFLCHTHRDDARRILDTFGDTYMSVASDELTKAGIVSIYEAY